MSLSFAPEMRIALPEYLTATGRFKNINKLITFNDAWRKEAFNHLKKLLSNMKELEASDMDIGGAGITDKVWYRVYGKKEPSKDVPRYSDDEISAMLLSVLSDEQKVSLFQSKNTDFSLSIELDSQESLSRFRGDIYYENNTIVANFRRINEDLFPMEALGFSSPIINRLNLKHEKSGLVLVTGITGSGKSCTLDSIVNMNNKENKAHIVIIGNPIEFIHKPDKCIIRHREVGTDVLSFHEGTVQSLRQDPDIIVVGEMRDAETIAAVLEATDSGHKVFTTLHTSSAIDSLHRIIGEIPASEQDRVRNRLADMLSVVISQKLIPNKKGKLTLAKEILSVNASVRAAIKNNNINEIYQMITEGKKEGMITMEQDLVNLYEKNIIEKEVTLDFANNTKRVIQLLQY